MFLFVVNVFRLFHGLHFPGNKAGECVGVQCHEAAVPAVVDIEASAALFIEHDSAIVRLM